MALSKYAEQYVRSFLASGEPGKVSKAKRYLESQGLRAEDYGYVDPEVKARQEAARQKIADDKAEVAEANRIAREEAEVAYLAQQEKLDERLAERAQERKEERERKEREEQEAAEAAAESSSGGSSSFNSGAYTDMLIEADPAKRPAAGLTSNPQPIPNAEYNPQSLEDAWDDVDLPPLDVELSGAYQYSQQLFRDLVDQYRGGVRENDHGNPNPMLRIIPKLYDGNYTVAEAIGVLFSGSPSDLSPEAVAAARENYLELSDQQISANVQAKN